MAVSDRDRRHFAAVAEAMAAEKAEQRADALRLSPVDRVVTGFLLGIGPLDPAAERALDERAAGQ